MLNHDLNLDTLVAAKTPQLTVPPPRLAPGRFRSHVSDLTWCSESDEMVKVCEQIARLRPPGRG